MRTRQPAPREREWAFLQAFLALAYTLQQESAAPHATRHASEAISELRHPGLQRIAASARNLTEASGAAIALGNSGTMVCVVRDGTSAPPIGAEFDALEGLSGECIRTGESVICVNAAADPRVNYQACRALNVASMLYLPLRSADGEMIGTLGVFSSQPLHFSQRDISALKFCETLVQEALAATGDDPDPTTLTVLLRKAEIAPAVEVAEPPSESDSGGHSVPVPETVIPVRQDVPPTPGAPKPLLAEPRDTIYQQSPAATFVGRVVDESVQDSEPESSQEKDPEQHGGRSLMPAVLALLAALLIAIGAWNHNRMTGLNTRTSPSQTPLPVPTVPPANSELPDVESAPLEQKLTSDLTMVSDETHATVTILLGKAIRFEGYQLDHPDRVYFDLHDVKLTDTKGKEIRNTEGLVSAVRLSLYALGTTRVVFDLRHAVNFDARLAENPQRLQIELRRTSGEHGRSGSESSGLPR